MKVTFPQILIAICILTCIGLISPSIIHVFESARIAAWNSRCLSHVKWLADAALIYSGDYDARYPNATSMPSHRSMISAYVKNKEAFQKVEDSTVPQFNFNLSGVKIADDPINPPSESDDWDTYQNPIYFITRYRKVYTEAYISYSDGATKRKQIEGFFDPALIYAPQFDRTGVTLAPADYLADQDPLKK